MTAPSSSSAARYTAGGERRSCYGQLTKTERTLRTVFDWRWPRRARSALRADASAQKGTLLASQTKSRDVSELLGSEAGSQSESEAQ